MNSVLALIMLGSVATAQLLVADASSQVAGRQSALRSASAPVDSSALPSAPRGKSTVLGGEIRKVDPVRDELILGVFGQRPIKILFDERTQVYLDGKAIPLGKLSPTHHASVQTVLDKTDVYALSIHMLSQLPEGEYQGSVISYNLVTHELIVSAALSRQPLKLFVASDTRVTREGPASLSSAPSGASDLVKGSLVSIQFTSDRKGRGVASRIAILAAPGSEFAFSGSLSALDIHSGLMVLVDPRDNKSYQIYFDSTQFPASRNLHEGDNVSVTAKYDGTRYVASALTVD
jgi:hypothetical protein